VLVEGGKRLFKQFGVMLVSAAKHPQVKTAEGQQFIDWVTGRAGPAVTASHKIGGEHLFFPSIGTSTPGADPSGDCAWAMLRPADTQRPGAAGQLQRKAKKLTGDTSLRDPPPGCGTCAWVIVSGQADVFITHRTNAVIAQRELPSLHIVALPLVLLVGVAHGLGIREAAPASARAFAQLCWLQRRRSHSPGTALSRS